MKDIKSIKKTYLKYLKTYIRLNRAHYREASECYFIRAFAIADILERDVAKDIIRLEQRF